MYEIVKMKNQLISDSLRFAAEIESQAENISQSHSILVSSKELFNNAYRIYRAIAENDAYEDKWRGEAAFKMWRLMSENCVPVQLSQGETKDEKIKEMLLFSASLGNEEASLELQVHKLKIKDKITK